MSYILLSSGRDDQGHSRSFNIFDKIDGIAVHIIEYFEEFLQMEEWDKSGLENPGLVPAMEYVLDDLYKFMDNTFGELCCLERQEDQPDLWIPQTSDWIKTQIYFYFRTQIINKQQQQQQPASQPQDSNNMLVD